MTLPDVHASSPCHESKYLDCSTTACRDGNCYSEFAKVKYYIFHAQRLNGSPFGA